MYILQSYTRLLLSFHYSCIKYTRLASNRVTMATTISTAYYLVHNDSLFFFFDIINLVYNALSHNALKMPILVSRGGTIVRAKDE